MSHQKKLKSSVVVFCSVCLLLMSVCSIQAKPGNREYIMAEDIPGMEPIATSRKSAEYVGNRIIVKFKKAVANVLEEEIGQGKPVENIKLSSKIDALNKKHKIKKMRALFPDFKNNQNKLRVLKSKNKAELTKKEAHILKRSKRAAKNAVVPDLSGIYVFELEEGQSAKQAVRDYGADSDVEYAELDYIVSIDHMPEDPAFEDDCLWGLHNTGEPYPVPFGQTKSGTADADIDAPEAWDYYVYNSEDTIVAVLDTGVDYNHLDLDYNMWTDANGYYGYDFVDDDSDPMDEFGHGTHCAGIIAAENDNHLDVVGVNCYRGKIMAIRWLTEQGGYVSDAVLAINYAVSNGADVLSNSWGGEGTSQSLQDAIDYAYSQGVVTVAAAGNGGTDRIGDDNCEVPHYPSNCDHVISVAATDSDDNKASFSNYGECVDIAAPGVDILSLRAEGTDMYGDGYHLYPYNNPQATMYICSGTSMACPHVAGACSFLLSLAPAYNVDEIVELITENGDPIADGICSSDSRLNLANAIEAAFSSQGRVKFDNAAYTCSDTTEVRLFDFDLRLQEQQSVTITTTGGDSEQISLTESGYDIGVFTGSINTDSNDVSTNDGTIQISHDETITVTYNDLDDGNGSPATVTDTAVIDCEPPIVSNIQVIPGPDPTITFTTDENAIAEVRWGEQCGGSYDIESGSEYTTSHSFELTGVEQSTDYYYVIEVTDSLDNTELYDNNSNCYSFTTTAGSDINVPADANTIQQAIDYCWDGYTVWIANGTYTGSGNRDIDFMGRAITVKSVNGPENCIIDCNGSDTENHQGFIFESHESSSSILDGFTIKNGNCWTGDVSWDHYDADNYGGGIDCEFSSPTIQNCIVQNCKANCGGGMSNYKGNPTVINCTFTQNTVVNAANRGGGVYTAGGSSTFTGCTFSNNYSDENGGGLFIFNYPFRGMDGGIVTVTDCNFIENSIGENVVMWCGGAGVYSCSVPGAVFENCNFIENSADSIGGGMASTQKLTLVNCTFNGNYTAVGGDDANDIAGGLYFSGNTTLTNCEFIDNSSNGYGGAIYQKYPYKSTVKSCAFENNTALKGGAVSIQNSDSMSLMSCLFASNTASQNGGAIYVNIGTDETEPEIYDCDITVDLCTFYDNQANAGDVVYCTYDANLNEEFVGTFSSSIIWGSSDPVYLKSPATLDISYCDIQGGYAGEGNINSDPLFVDSDSNDFSLDQNSPCINAGQPDFDDYSQTDLAGSVRIAFCRVDIGAYELTGVYNQNTQQFYSTIQDAVDDANQDDVIIVSPGVYNESIEIDTRITLRSDNPDNWDVVEATVIDTSGWACVALDNSSASGTVVEGLTFTGGGICGIDSEVGITIKNCIAKDNAYSGISVSACSGLVEISNCKLTDNTTGINCNGLQNGVVKNNWIYGNNNGIRVEEPSNFVIRNNTIVNNTSYGILSSYATTVPISNCILWNNGDDLDDIFSATYSCIQDCNDANGVGNICGDANDPKFVDADANDYHLKTNSPCLEAGDPNTTIDEEEKDIDGCQRICGVYIDMGATEYSGSILNTTSPRWANKIQGAINHASNGDVIVISPGIYTGDGNRDIDFCGKQITVQSTNPNDWDVVADTVIDCMATAEWDPYRGFYFHSGETAGSAIRGLTIKNGFAGWYSESFYDNIYPGHAIFCDSNSSPKIENCLITDNGEENGWFNSVIACYSNSNPTIQNCKILNNIGHAIVSVWQSYPLIINSVIATNNINSGEYWHNTGSCIRYHGCDSAVPEIRNCTIANNSVDSSSWHIMYNYNSSPQITNCIMWGNTGFLDAISNGGTSDPNFSYCDIESCGGSGVGWDPNFGTDGGGNIDTDPCFVDEDANDFHIKDNSPCLDAGDPNGSYNGETDIDGQTRVIGEEVDMGADEISRVHNITQEKWYNLIQEAVDDANDDDEIVVYPGTYYESPLINTSVTLRSLDPNDWDVVEATIIVTSDDDVRFGFYTVVVLEGFTIGGGTRGVGGALSGSTVKNCIIKDNSLVGVEGYSSNSMEVVNCKIVNNGVGIYSTYSSMAIKNNWIYGNGAGIDVRGSGSPVIRNNTIADNNSYGIYSSSGSTTPVISNCILWDNGDELDSAFSATYSCIKDCNDANGVGNICGDANDPLFVDDANDDYRLDVNSPCIDVGDPNQDYTGEYDIDGDNRVIDITGKGEDDNDVDIGGDEYDSGS